MDFTAAIKWSAEWWIGWMEKITGVNCQEHSLEALGCSLVEALAEALDYNRCEPLTPAGGDFQVEKVIIA